MKNKDLYPETEVPKKGARVIVGPTTKSSKRWKRVNLITTSLISLTIDDGFSRGIIPFYGPRIQVSEILYFTQFYRCVPKLAKAQKIPVIAYCIWEAATAWGTHTLKMMV